MTDTQHTTATLYTVRDRACSLFRTYPLRINLLVSVFTHYFAFLPANLRIYPIICASSRQFAHSPAIFRIYPPIFAFLCKFGHLPASLHTYGPIRSSPQICVLVDTLRSSRTSTFAYLCISTGCGLLSIGARHNHSRYIPHDNEPLP